MLLSPQNSYIKALNHNVVCGAKGGTAFEKKLGLDEVIEVSLLWWYWYPYKEMK